MIKILMAAIVLPFFVAAMNTPEPAYDVLPKVICKIIGAYYTSVERKGVEFNFHEDIRMSHNWNTLGITDEHIFDQQLWFGPSTHYFRIDNDIIGEKNTITFKSNNPPTHVLFDGPNHDPSEHKGIALVAHYRGKEPVKISVLRMAGVRGHRKLDDFDTTFELPALKVGAIALAQKGRFAVAQNQKDPSHYGTDLHLFNYQNASIALQCSSFIPQESYKKLAWIYGKTLAAIDEHGKLHILAVDEKSVSVYPQKISLTLVGLAVHNPGENHELLLVDNNHLYHANLKHRSSDGKIVYKKICSYDYDMQRVGFFKDRAGIVTNEKGTNILSLISWVDAKYINQLLGAFKKLSTKKNQTKANIKLSQSKHE